MHFLQLGPVLIEEFLDGQEVSLFLLADGTTVLPLSPAQDYKRVGDGDTGPNTGGMGAYSPLPWLPAGFVDEVVATVALPVIRQLAAEGTPFSGLLYCGLIVTAKGLRVIEFNARFGDPETQVVLLEAAAAVPGVRVLHAATARDGDRIVATGGRVLNVVATAGDFAEARARAYRALEAIHLEGAHYRTDIAARVLS